MIELVDTVVRACVTMAVVVFATRVLDIAVLTVFWVLIACAACVWLWLLFIDVCERFADCKRDSFVPSETDPINGQSNPGDDAPAEGVSDDNNEGA